jgi:hypothetical protein
MKRLIVLSVMFSTIALFTGCTGAGVASGLAAVGGDNATVIVNYGGLYGPIKIVRMNPKPGQTVTFSGSDGSIATSWPTNSPITNAVSK